MNTKAIGSPNSKTTRLELGTRILLLFGFFWVLAGGGVASWIGVQQIVEGSLLSGSVTVVMGAIVFISAWFMKRELNR